MNTTKTAAIIFFLLLICTSAIGSVFAQTTVSSGVSEGDSFKYDIKYLWASSSPVDVVPLDWVSKNQTDYLQVNVDVAVGNALRLSTVWRFLNGTELSGTQLEEIGNNTSTGFIYIYAANLNAGNHLFPLATDLPFIINNTIFRIYDNSNEPRAINHIQVNRTDFEDRKYSYMDLYFDKTTGVLVEAKLEEVYSFQPTQTYTTLITIKESSLWNITPQPTVSSSASPSTTTSPQITNAPSNTQNGDTPTANFDMLLIILVIILVVIVIVILFVFLTRRPKTTPKSHIVPEEPSSKFTADSESNTTGMVECKNCGAENPNANEFCGKCGKRLHT